MSQAIFALTLNATPSLVSQWERGEKKPSGLHPAFMFKAK